jgi:hypothetical protein
MTSYRPPTITGPPVACPAWTGTADEAPTTDPAPMLHGLKAGPDIGPGLTVSTIGYAA